MIKRLLLGLLGLHLIFSTLSVDAGVFPIVPEPETVEDISTVTGLVGFYVGYKAHELASLASYWPKVVNAHPYVSHPITWILAGAVVCGGVSYYTLMQYTLEWRKSRIENELKKINAILGHLNASEFYAIFTNNKSKTAQKCCEYIRMLQTRISMFDSEVNKIFKPGNSTLEFYNSTTKRLELFLQYAEKQKELKLSQAALEVQKEQVELGKAIFAHQKKRAEQKAWNQKTPVGKMFSYTIWAITSPCKQLWHLVWSR